MATAALSRLEIEVNCLELTAKTALKNPFIPAAAREGIAQAIYCIRTLAAEVKSLKATCASNGDTLNNELRDMRRQIGSAVTQVGELGGR